MAQKLPPIAAAAALDLLTRASASAHAWIDVRSEGEFAQGALPGFVNAPLLNDAERHQVGIAYKRQGQDAAIALGHQLLAPHRDERIAQWRALAAGAPSGAVVACWRGGLRSALVGDEIRQGGLPVQQVQGGYKAMRHELLAAFEQLPPLVVVAGFTGSGKSKLLTSLQGVSVLDLEACASHRGSSFGSIGMTAQPSQATFENRVGLGLWRVTRPTVVEDESPAIGRVRVPHPIAEAIQAAPVVWIEASVEERARGIYADYVAAPLAAGVGAGDLAVLLVEAVQRLRRRLGGARAQEIEAGIRGAFVLARGKVPECGVLAPWIEALLADYYDKSYAYGFERLKRQILFRGPIEECRAWISRRYA